MDTRRYGLDVADAIEVDYVMGSLEDADRALLDYAVKLTRSPDQVREADIERLRRRGYSDPAIHRAAQIVGYFNYYNRLASGLGVADEEGWEAR